MSTVSELKKKFEQTKKVTLTPEQHAAALRQKDRDLQEATRIAKARAARYNMTLRSLELANAAKVTEAVKTDKVKRDQTMKSFAQPGRRVSGMKPSAQAKVEASQQILASALSHERSPQLAVDVVNKVAQQVEDTLKPENSSQNLDDKARAKQNAEEAAILEARQEEQRRLEEEEARKAKELEAAAAKAAAEAEAAAKAAEEARAAAEAEASAALKRKAEEEEAKARKAAEEAESARKAADEAEAAAAQPEATPEPAIDDGARFEMTSLSAALDQGSEEAINKAIVTDFLAEHDPSKVAEVDKLLAENKGTEGELMKELADKYSDPAATEIKVTAEVIVQIESEGKADAPTQSAENEDEDFLEKGRKDAERIKLEEEAKIAAMDDTERKAYMEQLAAQAKHQEDKDKMLKSQLNVYGSSGAAALLGGRGRGRGKARPKSDRQTEYIVNGVNQGGEWEVNAE